MLRGINRIEIFSDKPISYYESSEFEEPPMLIISIPEAELAFSHEQYMTIPVNSPNIKEVRLHQFYDYLAQPPKMLRIIVEFKEKSNYRIDLVKKDRIMNIDVQIPKIMQVDDRKEKLMRDALKKAEEKEAREMLEEERQERILAREAERIKEEARKKEAKERLEEEKEASLREQEPVLSPEEYKPVKGKDYTITEELRRLQKIEEKPEGKKPKKEPLKKEELAKAAEKPPSVEELVRKGEEERKLIGPATPTAKEEKKQKKKITTLVECIDIGLENYLPAKISLDEVKLAELKMTEAKRALFPSASFKKVRTDGDIFNVDFLEREYTLKMEQPLYYGGRLRDAVRKTELNLEIAKRNYNKLKVDFIAKIETAFYNFVGASMTLAAQEELKAEAEHILGIAKRRYDSGLSTEVEYLNLQNLYASILYQINVAQMEMGSAKLQLEHELNLDTSSYEIEVKEPLQYAKADIDLEKSIQLAYENRPELFINELTVRVKELEEKIIRNKNRFKVDLTGSYGKGGGAYKTEKLDLGETWYAGILFSKPFGGNTISYNLSEDQTAPRLGQTTRTGSRSQTWEFNLLNNIIRYSEEKTAQIDLKKAINELNEVKKNVSTEVREAFFRYEKSIMQVDGSVIKIQLRQKEIQANQAKVDVDEALLSELLESKVKLTDEKVSYINSVSSYFTAISGINKAIGLSGLYNLETPPTETKVAEKKQ